ncbi:uncharacterized protein LOC131932139 [Physella acuta]|uniref:uncharacterized protein LOC131932139 n=1 Tax=Physella acuta TaxID=109671 RepID=UPI0027DBCC44|nr:uncharacterized protein LOC131932139 [Physella acuta]
MSCSRTPRVQPKAKPQEFHPCSEEIYCNSPTSQDGDLGQAPPPPDRNKSSIKSAKSDTKARQKSEAPEECYSGLDATQGDPEDYYEDQQTLNQQNIFKDQMTSKEEVTLQKKQTLNEQPPVLKTTEKIEEACKVGTHIKKENGILNTCRRNSKQIYKIIGLVFLMFVASVIGGLISGAIMLNGVNTTQESENTPTPSFNTTNSTGQT